MISLNFNAAKNFLQQKESKLDVNTKDALRSGEVSIITDFVQHKVGIGNSGVSGILDFLKPSNVQEKGVSDFDGNKLKSRNLVANRLMFAYGEDPASNKEASVDYSPTSEAVPTELQACELHVIQDDKLIKRFDVADLVQPFETKAVSSTNGETLTTAVDPHRGRNVELEDLMLLAGDRATKFQLHFPEGVTLTPSGSNYGYIKLFFAGMGTYIG